MVSRRPLPRDFVTTSEGLVFAVVDRSVDGEPIPCFLRYRRRPDGRLEKLGTAAANALLRNRYPQYLFHCNRRDADLHAVHPKDVLEHLSPRQRVQELFHSPLSSDPMEARTLRLLNSLSSAGLPLSSVGVTGSLLAGSQRADSDIDLVIYDTDLFQLARNAISSLIVEGRLAELDEAAWRDAFRRRGCALTYDEFRWHEKRKMNKALFEGTKFDISLVTERTEPLPVSWRKLGLTVIESTVVDDRASFDYPACLRIAHERIGETVSFTATYSGQARAGERIEVRGLLEEAENGLQRIVVGSDREAAGQYIRVIR
jgi:predicted nucleotidyltransferase